MSQLWAIDAGLEQTPSRYAALISHPVARKIRELFTSRNSGAVATLSDVCSVLFGRTSIHSREQQQQALEWLDLLTCAVDENNTAFLPLRSHVCHQTLPGLWCCADKACPAKKGSRLDEREWHFGQVYLTPKKHCSCGSPAYELIACDECGAIFLQTEIQGNRVVRPEADSAVDELALDAEESENGDEESGLSGRTATVPPL